MTLTVEPLSAVTCTTPLACVASVIEAIVETPFPKTKLGLLGASVSRVKLVLPMLLTLPAASIVLVVTLITPSVKVLISLSDNTTA